MESVSSTLLATGGRAPWSDYAREQKVLPESGHGGTKIKGAAQRAGRNQAGTCADKSDLCLLLVEMLHHLRFA